ncbi:MAG: NYN domain-containing protein [Dissulfurispiraceae bacterium]|jgi:hypothetical protein
MYSYTLGGAAISSIIIDGYNVIGTAHSSREKAREDIIDLMIRYKRSKLHDITIVFDGYKAGRGNENLSVRGGVAVIYSGLGEKADEVIRRIITKDRKEWIVVSSDKEIARHAWAVNSIPVPSDAFIQIVSAEVAGRGAGGIEGGAGDETDMKGALGEWTNSGGEYEEACSGKGNPYKLSKRGKSVIRALSKL